jgi:hypothetical protein
MAGYTMLLWGGYIPTNGRNASLMNQQSTGLDYLVLHQGMMMSKVHG